MNMSGSGDVLTNPHNVINTGQLTRFTAIDYTFFSVMLLIYIGIGIYFGYFDKAIKTVDEYLYGSGKMKVFPIAVSLVSSNLSAYTIIAIPAEIYAYGSQFTISLATYFLSALTVNHVMLPVFFKNGLSNSYMYLERRFNKSVQRICIATIFICGIPAIPFLSYIPALAFAQVSGLNIHLINTIVLLICMFYTMVGGIKAVVWTDVVQAVIMVSGVVIIIVSAIVKVGGLKTVWNVALEGNRLQAPDMTFDLTTRSTFWNIFIGQYIQFTASVGLNPISCQRVMSLPTISKARKSIYIYAIGLTIIMFLNCSIGFIMYAFYSHCDPMKKGIVEKIDQMVPHFVQEIVGYIPGMPGIFISCVFSASLSSISPILNSMAGIVYTDYIRGRPTYHHTDRKGDWIMKAIILVLGVFCILMGFAYNNLKSVLQIFTAIVGITYGALFGIFLFGMFYPRGTSKGAFAGLFTSIISVGWVMIGSLWHMHTGKLVYPTLPSSIEGCDSPVYNLTYIAKNITEVVQNEATSNGFSIYHIAFPWFICIGFLVFFIVAIPVSHLTGNSDDAANINPNLIHPMAHFLLPKSVILHSALLIKSRKHSIFEPKKTAIH